MTPRRSLQVRTRADLGDRGRIDVSDLLTVALIVLVVLVILYFWRRV